MTIRELNPAEFVFQYGVAREEYRRAYRQLKEFEEELDRRYQAKMNLAINTQGKIGIESQIEKEMNSVEEWEME